MLMVSLTSADTFTESVTFTPISETPGASAFPEIVPLPESIDSPEGKLPDTVDQRNGATPPLTERGAE
jgi:hypothetical protein